MKSPRKGLSDREFNAVAMERYCSAWEHYQNGMCYAEVGKAIGRMSDPSRPISGVAAKRLVSRYEHTLKTQKIREENNIPDGMTARAWHVLQKYGMSASEVEKAIISGDIEYIPNVGSKTLLEIREWMGPEIYDVAKDKCHRNIMREGQQ